MRLTGLSMLQIEDEDGRIVSSGHFRNEYGRVEAGLTASAGEDVEGCAQRRRPPDDTIARGRGISVAGTQRIAPDWRPHVHAHRRRRRRRSVSRSPRPRSRDRRLSALSRRRIFLGTGTDTRRHRGRRCCCGHVRDSLNPNRSRVATRSGDRPTAGNAVSGAASGIYSAAWIPGFWGPP